MEESPLAMNRWKTRLGVVLAWACFLVPLWSSQADSPPPPKNEYFKGKVVLLKEYLAPMGIKVDDDAAPYLLALVGDDGTIMPLVKDEGARMLYQDKSLRNRPMRLTARRVADSNLLRV